MILHTHIYIHATHLDGWRPEPNEACEEALVELAVLLEGHGLYDRGELVMVSDENHTLQPASQHRIQVLHEKSYAQIHIMYMYNVHIYSGVVIIAYVINVWIMTGWMRAMWCETWGRMFMDQRRFYGGDIYSKNIWLWTWKMGRTTREWNWLKTRLDVRREEKREKKNEKRGKKVKRAKKEKRGVKGRKNEGKKWIPPMKIYFRMLLFDPSVPTISIDAHKQAPQWTMNPTQRATAPVASSVWRFRPPGSVRSPPWPCYHTWNRAPRACVGWAPRACRSSLWYGPAWKKRRGKDIIDGGAQFR